MIGSLFDAIVQSSGERPALSGDAHELSYTELQMLAGGIECALRTNGIGPGQTIAIDAVPSVHAIAAMIAVIRSGAAFLPIDGRSPAARRTEMLRSANVAATLSDRPRTEAWPALQLDLRDIGPQAPPGPPVEIDPQQSAYVMFTSGSTGAPKGVRVPHAAIERLVVANDMLSLSQDDVLLALAPIAFDASTFEIWGALLNGGRLAMPTSAPITPETIGEMVTSQGVTVLWLTAGLFHEVVDAGCPGLQGLHCLLAGGDVLSVRHVNRALELLPTTTIVNGYGPTENTTFTACHAIDTQVTTETVPIGRAISGTTVYVLDSDLQEVSGTALGELYTGGRGLAHGYVNDPRLTAARFLPDPFTAQPGGRMYQTGDRARTDPEGVLLFLGRDDSQVKLNGFRVEIGEVEEAISRVDGVASAVVVVQGGADTRRLVAFMTGNVDPSGVRHRLADTLPEYAIPSVIRVIDSLPLTDNGKVDRGMLASTNGFGRPALTTEYRAPTGAVECWLVQLWNDLLGLDWVGVHDDFFELGGQSLVGVRILRATRERYGVSISPESFYEDPSPGGMARLVADSETLDATARGD
jgi:amino acid adenylation domain-containing protein